MNEYKIGDKVELHSTGEIITIVGIIDGNEFLGMDSNSKPKIIVKSDIRVKNRLNAEKEVTSSSSKERDSSIVGLKSKKGDDEFYLAFEYTMSGSEDGFIPYLVNKSGSAYDISLQIRSSGELLTEKKFGLAAYQAIKLDRLSSNDFSVPVTFYIHVLQIFTDGSSEEDYQKIIIKSTQMQENPTFDGNLGMKVIRRPIELKMVPDFEELKDYSKGLKKPEKGKGDKIKIDVYNPMFKATFNPEIDLHLEQLVDNPEEFTASEALKIQLDRFLEFINQAYQLTAHDVVVIHGKGKGRLRAEIERICRVDSRIEGCRPGYSKGMDYGATIIYFK